MCTAFTSSPTVWKKHIWRAHTWWKNNSSLFSLSFTLIKMGFKNLQWPVGTVMATLPVSLLSCGASPVDTSIKWQFWILSFLHAGLFSVKISAYIYILHLVHISPGIWYCLFFCLFWAVLDMVMRTRGVLLKWSPPRPLIPL